MHKYTEFVTHTPKMFGKEVVDEYGTEKIADAETLIACTKLADHAFVMRIMGRLLGKVLTTVEATTSSEAQAKAIKDLMRGHFGEEMDFVASVMFDQNELDKVATESLDDLSEDDVRLVDIDEALGVKS